MAKKFFQKYAYDIAFDEDTGTNFISWNTGLMVFFVTLMMAFNLSLSSVSKSWVDGLSGAMTIEIKPPMVSIDNPQSNREMQVAFQGRVKEVMEMLRKNGDIKESRMLSDGEVRDLIKPWIGENIALDAIPLPTLIDVKVKADANLTQLKLELTKIEPAASIDNHSDTIGDIEKIMGTAKAFVSMLTMLVIFLAVVSISGVIRSKLLIHRDEVETLHLIGASNEYIARQFRQHTLEKTIKGAIMGVIFTFVTLAVIGLITNTLSFNLFSYISLMPIHWLMLAIGPVIVGTVIAHITAQATALRELSKLP